MDCLQIEALSRIFPLGERRVMSKEWKNSRMPIFKGLKQYFVQIFVVAGRNSLGNSYGHEHTIRGHRDTSVLRATCNNCIAWPQRMGSHGQHEYAHYYWGNDNIICCISPAPSLLHDLRFVPKPDQPLEDRP